MNSKNALLSSIVAVITFFSAQNIHSVNLNFLFWDFSISLIILIYIIFFSGVLVGFLYANRKVKKRSIHKEETEKSEEKIDSKEVKKSKKFFKKNK